MEDHPTHLCPWLVEAQKLLVQQQPVVLMNPFPHGKNLTQASSSADGGSQGTPPSFTRNIFRTVVDEGASTCVMSLVCWKVIGQPILYPSPTLLTAFDGHSFKPHGIIHSLSVQLGGKTVCVEVKVVDTPLD